MTPRIAAVAREMLIEQQARRCLDALKQVAEVASRRGATLLAIKGVHLAFGIAPRPYRWMDDADALVIGDYRNVVDELRASDPSRVAFGGTLAARITIGRTGVDLHRRVFPPGFAALDMKGIIGRARAHPAFGPGIVIPDPVDAVAIAIGHFVKDALGSVGHGSIASDLTLLLGVATNPAQVVERLRSHGVRRMAIATFAHLGRRDARWGEWLFAMNPSSVELSIARLAHELLPGAPSRLRTLVLPSLLNDALPRVVLGATIGALRTARLEIRGRFAND